MKRGFTLIEIIIVIIIVGILAAAGITQYSLMVEKSRLAEAKIRIGAMRQLAHEYYMNNGTVMGIAYSDVGVDYTCRSDGFYRYNATGYAPGYVNLRAYRCTNQGKTPNVDRGYNYFMTYYPATGESKWCCYYNDDTSSCFGLPTS